MKPYLLCLTAVLLADTVSADVLHLTFAAADTPDRVGPAFRPEAGLNVLSGETVIGLSGGIFHRRRPDGSASQRFAGSELKQTDGRRSALSVSLLPTAVRYACRDEPTDEGPLPEGTALGPRLGGPGAALTEDFLGTEGRRLLTETFGDAALPFLLGPAAGAPYIYEYQPCGRTPAPEEHPRLRIGGTEPGKTYRVTLLVGRRNMYLFAGPTAYTAENCTVSTCSVTGWGGTDKAPEALPDGRGFTVSGTPGWALLRFDITATGVFFDIAADSNTAAFAALRVVSDPAPTTVWTGTPSDPESTVGDAWSDGRPSASAGIVLEDRATSAPVRLRAEGLTAASLLCLSEATPYTVANLPAAVPVRSDGLLTLETDGGRCPNALAAAEVRLRGRVTLGNRVDGTVYALPDADGTPVRLTLGPAAEVGRVVLGSGCTLAGSGRIRELVADDGAVCDAAEGTLTVELLSAAALPALMPQSLPEGEPLPPAVCRIRTRNTDGGRSPLRILRRTPGVVLDGEPTAVLPQWTSADGTVAAVPYGMPAVLTFATVRKPQAGTASGSVTACLTMDGAGTQTAPMREEDTVINANIRKPMVGTEAADRFFFSEASAQTLTVSQQLYHNAEGDRFQWSAGLPLTGEAADFGRAYPTLKVRLFTCNDAGGLQPNPRTPALRVTAEDRTTGAVLFDTGYTEAAVPGKTAALTEVSLTLKQAAAVLPPTPQGFMLRFHAKKADSEGAGTYLGIHSAHFVPAPGPTFPDTLPAPDGTAVPVSPALTEALKTFAAEAGIVSGTVRIVGGRRDGRVLTPAEMNAAAYVLDGIVRRQPSPDGTPVLEVRYGFDVTGIRRTDSGLEFDVRLTGANGPAALKPAAELRLLSSDDSGNTWRKRAVFASPDTPLRLPDAPDAAGLFRFEAALRSDR